MDVRQSPHCGTQQGRSGANAGSQDIEQVPDTTMVVLKDNVHSSDQLLKNVILDQNDPDLEI